MADMEALKQAMGDLDEDVVKECLNAVMADGGSQASEAMEACQEGMNVIGDKFESGEYFVGDLIYAGELMTEAVDILKPALVGTGSDAAGGKVILCTVEGDLHDIGKNIVKSMVEAGGIEVIDLGIDTKPAAIIKAMQDDDVHVVLLSGVLTLAVDSMKNIVEQTKAAGLRDDCKILIGGAPVNEEACKLVGADDWASNPQKTVQKSQEWLTAYAG